jgi:Asp-tRNA(Asn)/Glu-tRNA(Gln) amidotransferase A subunit family amidase
LERSGVLMQEIQWMPAWQLAELVRSGQLSARDLCSTILERISCQDGLLHSFVTVIPEHALDAAAALDDGFARGERSGAFRGVPYSTKDNLFTKGVRTTCGSRLLESFVPDQDAGSVRRMTEAGAVLVGKTNLPEFSSWRRSRNLVVGETVNPWDLSRSSGASSGGSAAAVAAGLVPISIGTDDGGSIRLPAALCGVFGFLPSPGRVPLDGTVVVGSVSQAGPLCRDVRDAAVFLDAMADRSSAVGGAARDAGFLASLDRGITGTRVAWVVEHVGDEVRDARVAEVAHTAAVSLGGAGAQVDEPEVAWVSAMGAMAPLTAENSAGFPGLRPSDVPEFRRAIEHTGWEELLSPYLTAERLLPRPSPSAADLAAHEVCRLAVAGQLNELFATHDLVLTPTIDALPAPASSAWEPGYGRPGESDAETISAYVKYTLRVNIAGCPAASVPCGFVDGLPVGLQIIGRPGADHIVLRASRALEQLRPWAGVRPPARDQG